MKGKSPVLELAVVILSVTAVQAVPTTYQYHGNPFTFVSGTYSTSDSVSGMLTLAAPLGVNTPLTAVSPTAFTLSDGLTTITNLSALNSEFQIATGPTGEI